MAKIVICEGPDGSGKTTLAGRLVDEFDLEYRRPPESLLSSTHGPSEGLHEWWRDQLRLPSDERRRGVYDRCFWVSEPIYQAVSMRPPMCTTELIWRGINDLWVENPLLIFCMTDENTMMENVYTGGRPRLAGLEGDERQKLRAVNFLYWAFYGIWQQASNHVVQWNYATSDFGELIRAVADQRRVVR